MVSVFNPTHRVLSVGQYTLRPGQVILAPDDVAESMRVVGAVAGNVAPVIRAYAERFEPTISEIIQRRPKAVVCCHSPQFVAHGYASLIAESIGVPIVPIEHLSLVLFGANVETLLMFGYGPYVVPDLPVGCSLVSVDFSRATVKGVPVEGKVLALPQPSQQVDRVIDVAAILPVNPDWWLVPEGAHCMSGSARYVGRVEQFTPTPSGFRMICQRAAMSNYVVIASSKYDHGARLLAIACILSGAHVVSGIKELKELKSKMIHVVENRDQVLELVRQKPRRYNLPTFKPEDWKSLL